MSSNNRTARIAGLLYLGVVVTGIFSLMYVPSKLFIWNNAATTFDKIVGAESLFRLGMVSYLICYTFFLFLPLVLFKLLKPVNEMAAKLMVILAVISVPMAFVNIQNQFIVLSLISDGQYLQMFSKDQLQSQVLLYLNQYDNGNLVISIFSGLWLFPFGYLVFKSGILPRILGVLLMFGCFCYLINFLGNALLPDYSKVGITSYISLPASIGEIGICLWLLVVGAKEKETFYSTL